MVPLEYTPVVFDRGPWCKTGCHTSASKRRAPSCAQVSHALSIPTGMLVVVWNILLSKKKWEVLRFIIPNDELVFFRFLQRSRAPGSTMLTSIPPLLTGRVRRCWVPGPADPDPRCVT